MNTSISQKIKNVGTINEKNAFYDELISSKK